MTAIGMRQLGEIEAGIREKLVQLRDRRAYCRRQLRRVGSAKKQAKWRAEMRKAEIEASAVFAPLRDSWK